MFFGCLLAARNLKGVSCISGVGVAGPKFYIVCLRLPQAHVKKIKCGRPSRKLHLAPLRKTLLEMQRKTGKRGRGMNLVAGVL